MSRFIATGYMLLLALAAPCQETGAPIIIGQKYILESKVLGEDRPLLVYLPEDYHEDSMVTYPVLYLLDGASNFHHTTATVDFLDRKGKIPAMIVVGIPNTNDRTRDLTPPTETDGDQFPTSGSADKLLKFMQGELFPYMSSKYRVADYKMLVGHSFGGLFAIHTLVNHPGIFDAYLAISPSLWWNDQDLVMEQTKQFFKDQRDLKGHLYMTMGGEDGTMLGGAWKFAALLEEKGPMNLRWYFDRMPEESHGSIPQRSTIKGLEFIFAEWQWSKLAEQMEVLGVAALESYETTMKELYGLPIPLKASDLNRLAEKLLDQNQVALAGPIFERSTELFSESDQAWFGYGNSLFKEGKFEEAVVALRRGLELNPSNLQCLALLKRLGEDVSDLLPDVDLSEDELHAYAAEYALKVGATLKVFVEDGHLYAASPPVLTKEQLTPLGDDRFFIISKNSSINFVREDGQIATITVDTPDGEFKGVKK